MISSLAQGLKFIVAGLQGLVLIPLVPRTIGRIWNALRSPDDGQLWAFGPIDAGFRPWYTKIARDFRRRGRFGFAWDDGLGIPLDVRVYNNWATYALLDALGTSRFLAAGWAAAAVAAGLAVGSAFGPRWGGVAGLLTAGSPLVVTGFTHRGKPEVIWWPVALVAVWLVFAGPAWVGGLVWSSLAWVNVPVAVMMAVVVGPAALADAAGDGGTFTLLASTIPGILKGAIRAWHMWRAGFMGSLTTEQSRLWKLPWHPQLYELPWMFLFTASVLLSAVAYGEPGIGATLVVAGVGLYWVNHRLIYLNDPQSYRFCFWAVGLGYAAATASAWGAAVVAVMAFNHPVLCGVPTRLSRRRVEASDVIKEGWLRVKGFPDLEPVSLPSPPSVMEFLGRIPDGARFLAEADGDPRTESCYRGFWQWTEEFLPERDVDLANEIYTRMAEAPLVDQVLNRFRAQDMEGVRMRGVARSLGASHVVAFSSSTVEVLVAQGYRPMAFVNLAPLEAFRELLRTPADRLVLLEDPEPVGLVSGAREVKRSGSTLVWEARAGERHQVRYRYHVAFRAYQNGEELEVDVYRPFPELKLAFAEVCAPRDGLVRLTYDPGPGLRWGVRGFPRDPGRS